MSTKQQKQVVSDTTYDEYDDGMYTVGIRSDRRYGYFEHNKLGDESGGGLWFDRTERGEELIDYDGVFELPQRVVNILRELGFYLDPEYYPEGGVR